MNENTKGLLRQYLPKGSDLSICSQAELDAIAHRPEGAFDFRAYWADALKLSSVAHGARTRLL